MTLSLEEQETIAFQIEEIRGGMAEDDFQREFFESLAEGFEKREWLSVKQRECLTRIYNRVTDT